MLKGILRSLFGSHPHRKSFEDPVLGQLKAGESGWTVSLTLGQDSFELIIGGASEPSAALLAHAADIVNDYDSFKKAVQDCIESESRDYPEDVKTEMRALEIDKVALFWPDRPDDGMIFFRGAEDAIRLWRCDYIARKPTGLGCDT